MVKKVKSVAETVGSPVTAGPTVVPAMSGLL